MYRIVVEALALVRAQGVGVLLERINKPKAWRRLIYGWLQFRDWKPILARKYLSGQGLEIGALHNPLPVSAGACVTYVDRLDVAKLRAHYPELSGLNFVNVDIVDDGEVLGAVPQASQDFIIANHFLEHCENPLGTIRTHLSKLKSGGLLFYTVPDRRMTFDWKRRNTPFEHLISDDANGPHQARIEHYREWAALVLDKKGAEIDETAAKLMRERFNIHFHCWDKRALRELFERARTYLANGFDTAIFRPNGPEIIVILRREA